MITEHDLSRVKVSGYWHQCQAPSLIHAGSTTLFEFMTSDGEPLYRIETITSNGRQLFIPGIVGEDGDFTSMINITGSGRVMTCTTETFLEALGMCADHLKSLYQETIENFAMSIVY